MLLYFHMINFTPNFSLDDAQPNGSAGQQEGKQEGEINKEEAQTDERAGIESIEETTLSSEDFVAMLHNTQYITDPGHFSVYEILKNPTPEQAAKIKEAVDFIPPEVRYMAKQVYVEGKSQADVGKSLPTPVSGPTVGNRIRKEVILKCLLDRMPRFLGIEQIGRAHV